MLSVSFGPLVLSWSLIIFYSALIVAYGCSRYFSYKRGVQLSDALFSIGLLAVLGARAMFVAQYFSSYENNIWKIIDIRDGGFSLVAAIATAVVVTGYKIYKQPQFKQGLIVSVASALLVLITGNGIINALNHSQQLPDIVLQNMQQTPVNIQNFAGKPMVVNLWATWCPPCRREMPVLVQAQQEYGDVIILFVNQGEGSVQVEKYLRQYEFTLQHSLLDAQASMGALVGSRALPSTLFYDAQGVLQHHHIGELSKASLTHAIKSIRPTQAQ